MGLLPNRQFLLARLRRAFLQDLPTPGERASSPPGANFLHAFGVQTSSPKGLSEAIPGVIAALYTDAR